MREPNPKELYEQANELLIYDPIQGTIVWRTTTQWHTAGVPAGSMSTGGYHKIYLKPYTYTDGVLAYLLQTGEYCKYIGRHDRDVTNLKFDNLYASPEKVFNNVKFARSSKREIAEFLDGNPLPIGKLAIASNNSLEHMRENLRAMVIDRYLEEDSKRGFTLTTLGHQELMRKGEFKETDRHAPFMLFQLVLPGTLTGNEGPKVFNREMR